MHILSKEVVYMDSVVKFQQNVMQQYSRTLITLHWTVHKDGFRREHTYVHTDTHTGRLKLS